MLGSHTAAEGVQFLQEQVGISSDVEGVHTNHPATALLGLCPREATYMNKETYSRQFTGALKNGNSVKK